MINVPLIAIRHAETAWNAEGRFQGLTDTALSEAGVAGAGKLGRRLGPLLERFGGADAMDWYSSPLGRAMSTMEIIRGEVGRNPAGYKVDGRLAEAGFGRWEGMTTLEVKARYPEERRARKADRWGFAPEGGGGSYADLDDAMRSFLADREVAGRPTVLVAHSGNLRVLAGLLCQLDRRETMALDVPHGALWLWDGSALERL